MHLLRVLTRKLTTAWRLLRTNPAHFAVVLRGDLHVYNVHSSTLAQVPDPEARPDLAFRPLTESELRQLANEHPDLQYQVEHLEAVGATSAFGVFTKGGIAHICWMMTEELDRRLPLRLVNLGPGEIEIAKAFTFPEFRGREIYPFAIRSICAVARESGFQRVFMITTSTNRTSRRGIEKAGLRPSGSIFLGLPPAIGTIAPIVCRTFRFR